MISFWVRPFDSRNDRRFARGEFCTLGSERNVIAEATRSSRIAIAGGQRDGGLSRRWDVGHGGEVDEEEAMEEGCTKRFGPAECHVNVTSKFGEPISPISMDNPQ